MRSLENKQQDGGRSSCNRGFKGFQLEACAASIINNLPICRCKKENKWSLKITSTSLIQNGEILVIEIKCVISSTVGITRISVVQTAGCMLEGQISGSPQLI